MNKTIDQVIDQYRDYLISERNMAPATVRAYTNDLRILAERHTGPISAISRNDLRAFVRALAGRYKPTTIRRIMHGLGTFFTWCILEGHHTEIVSHHVPLPRKNKAAPKWMSAAQVEAFISAAQSGVVPDRQGLALRLLAYLGMRPGELLGLTWENVNLSDRVIVLRNTKARRDRVLPLPPMLIDELTAQAEADGGQGRIFSEGSERWVRQKFYLAFNRVRDAAGIPQGYTAYSLRHGFGTARAMSGVPLHVIRDWMGHARISTTEQYLHVHAQTLDDLGGKIWGVQASR